MASADKDILGRRGERQAAAYLKKHGYRIVRRNYRGGGGEADLVAVYERTLVFIEVKTRRDLRWGVPSLAVDRRKQQHVVRAATHYLSRLRGEPMPCRFDVVEVVLGDDGPACITHIPDAFTPPRQP